MCYRAIMKNIRIALLSALLVATASSASAQLIVLGAGDAAQCYNYAKAGNQGTLSAIKVCDAAFGQMISRNDLAATHVNRGILRMRKGDLIAATQDYEDALEIKPDLTEAYVNLGAALIHQDRLDEALVALTTALEDIESGTRAAALVNRAIIYDRKDEARAAYKDLKAAEALKPDWDIVQTMLSRYVVVKKS